MRRTITAAALVIAGASLVVMAAACGGGDDGGSSSTDDPSTGPVHTLIDADLIPRVISSDLAIGENRFAVGLINEAEGGGVVAGADLHFKFFLLDDQGQGTLKFETDPESIVIEESFTHLHEDDEIHLHEGGKTGAYVAYPTFDTAGQWGVEVSGTTPDGTVMEPVRTSFTVSADAFGLAVGDPAPLTEQTVLADVDDIAEIDTSQVPIPEQHDMTVADAVTSGKPTVLAIVTPAFCTSQICGPVKELFDMLYDNYGDDANFVHVEPYNVSCVRAGDKTLFECANPIIEEWGLRSEPWVFIVDGEGNISAMFDGIVSYEEMEAALQEAI